VFSSPPLHQLRPRRAAFIQGEEGHRSPALVRWARLQLALTGLLLAAGAYRLLSHW
jgi:hypothetical protein